MSVPSLMDEVTDLARLITEVKLAETDLQVRELNPTTNLVSLVTLQLRERIENQADVQRVLGLELLPAAEDEKGERWAYLIETPFMTFPKFAWGTTNALNNDVRILGTCGAEWSAIEQFTALLAQGGEL